MSFILTGLFDFWNPKFRYIDELEATSVNSSTSVESESRVTGLQIDRLPLADDYKPDWTVADRLCVRATVVEAKVRGVRCFGHHEEAAWCEMFRHH